MDKLKPCPECGAKATVVHIYDTYDRADFGWTAGCPRYRVNDGIHKNRQKVQAWSKEQAIEAWNRRSDNERTD